MVCGAAIDVFLLAQSPSKPIRFVLPNLRQLLKIEHVH